MNSSLLLKVAASLSLKNAAKKADPVILEPIIKVDIVVPSDNMGDVMGQVTARRGNIDGMEERGNAQLLHSFVPLSEMFGYATALRSATQGRGTFTMTFDHYSAVPKSVQEDIIKKNGNND